MTHVIDWTDASFLFGSVWNGEYRRATYEDAKRVLAKELDALTVKQPAQPNQPLATCVTPYAHFRKAVYDSCEERGWKFRKRRVKTTVLICWCCKRLVRSGDGTPYSVCDYCPRNHLDCTGVVYSPISARARVKAVDIIPSGPVQVGEIA